jgi:hypothetical protein
VIILYKTWTPEEESLMFDLYEELGAIGMVDLLPLHSYAAIRGKARSLNLVQHFPGPWTQEEKEILLENYRDMGPGEIQKLLPRRSYGSIANFAGDLGLQDPARKYFPNEDAFDEINEYSAYWMGFLAADGYITPDGRSIKLGLAVCDTKHVEKFRDWISPGSPVQTYSETASVRINSVKLAEKLISYGIKNRKSWDLDYPKNFPREYNRHFLRGFTDGDGSLYIFKTQKKDGTNHYETIAWNVSGTHEMISSVINILKEDLDIDTNISEVKKTNLETKKYFVLSRSRLVGEKADKLLGWMYDDANIFLDRKKILYENWKQTATCKWRI